MHLSSEPVLCVVVVNWNNWEDTRACLDSLSQSTVRSFDVVLIDNGSDEQFEDELVEWTKQREFRLKRSPSSPNTVSEKPLAGERHLVLIRLPRNVGFARGSNIGIRYALRGRYKWVLLLNNDTIVERNTLGELLSECERTGAQVATARIFYDGDRSRLWNAGGKLTWYGSRRYYTESIYAQWPKDARRVRSVSFVTGCALFVKREVFERIGGLTERFFFGEEDYEFSLRLRRARIRPVCVDSSIVYHKVGRSSRKSRQTDPGRVLHYYLNRLVNMKTVYPYPVWQIWRIGVSLHLFWNLRRFTLSGRARVRMVWAVARRATMTDAVNQEELQYLETVAGRSQAVGDG